MELENYNYSKTFFWMFIGLLITFVTGYYVSLNQNMLYNICTGGMHFILFLVEIIIVIVLTRRISKMSDMTAKVLFCLYSFVTGLTFSVLFFAYSMQSIMYVFAVTGLLFLVFAFLGKTTKLDLSKFGSIFMMILIGLLVVSIINMFIGSTMLELVLSWVFVILFLGITAYDMQRTKQYIAVYGEEKGSIISALQLYLDFINIFIELLKLFGKSRD